MKRRLEDLAARVEAHDWSASLPEEVDASVLSVVLVSPLEAGRPAADPEAVSALREAGGGGAAPIFVVVPNGTSDVRVRRLYSAGAQAVFEWPREAILLPRLVAQILGVHAVRGRPGRPDAALRRAVRARLKLVDGLRDGLDLQVRDGVVHLRGPVDSLWRKETVEEVLDVVPGVRGVVVRDLWVEASPVPDRTIRRVIRTILENASSIDPGTLSMSVESGQVTLAGTVKSRAELRRVIDLIRSVRGVRAIRDLTTFAPGQQARDGVVAGRLRKTLARFFPEDDVLVAVFDGTVVLSGTAEDLKSRRALEELVAQDASVARVINKLDVDPPHRTSRV